MVWEWGRGRWNGGGCACVETLGDDAEGGDTDMLSMNEIPNCWLECFVQENRLGSEPIKGKYGHERMQSRLRMV